MSQGRFLLGCVLARPPYLAFFRGLSPRRLQCVGAAQGPCAAQGVGGEESSVSSRQPRVSEVVPYVVRLDPVRARRVEATLGGQGMASLQLVGEGAPGCRPPWRATPGSLFVACRPPRLGKAGIVMFLVPSRWRATRHRGSAREYPQRVWTDTPLRNTVCLCGGRAASRRTGWRPRLTCPEELVNGWQRS